MNNSAWIVVIVVLVLIGAGAWVFWERSDTVPAPAGNNTNIIVNATTTNSGENAPPGSIHNLPLPAAVAAARARAAADFGVNVDAAVVMSVFERQWSDSCLGLGGIAESCLQVITPGYEVTVEASGQTRVYRTNADGSVIREQK